MHTVTIPNQKRQSKKSNSISANWLALIPSLGHLVLFPIPKIKFNTPLYPSLYQKSNPGLILKFLLDNKKLKNPYIIYFTI